MVPDNWSAIWRAAEQIVTLRWWLQVVSLKLEKYDSFVYSAFDRLIDELSLAVRDLVEPVATKDRLRDDVRSAGAGSVYSMEHQAQHLVDLRRVHQRANEELASAEDGTEEYFHTHDRYCKQIMQYASELEVRLDEVVERALDEAGKRLFRFYKVLDEGVYTRDVFRIVVWWSPRHMDPDLPAEGRPLFALNEPRIGDGALKDIWFKELKVRWAEIGVGKQLPMPPADGLSANCLDPDSRRWAVERLKEMVRAMLAEAGAEQSEVSQEWLKGTRRELNTAFGMSATYGDFLERQASKGALELRKDRDGFSIRIRDSQLREKVKAKLQSMRRI